MRKSLFQNIEIPEGVEVTLNGDLLTIKGKAGENKREFQTENLTFEKKGNEIIIGNKKSTKAEKKLMNTIASHVRNMIQGTQEKYEYLLKICFSHFPISVEVQGNTAVIKNFLGEKKERRAKIPAGVEMKVNKDVITIIGNNKEVAGQAAANLETATKIRARDRRVFQDGIFLTSKAGKEI